MVSPAYGALEKPYVKIVAAFTLPTRVSSLFCSLVSSLTASFAVIVVGVLYSNITSRFVFLRIFDADSVHRLEHVSIIIVIVL